jgi:hypothetical protein
MNRPALLDRVAQAGFAVFDSGSDYDLNIIGLRNKSGTTNSFDDELHVIYTIRGRWQHHTYSCTTDPGLYWLHSGSAKGTAILCHDQQMRGVYELGLHRGKYEALVQRHGPVNVWRDRNRDSILDYGSRVDRGYFGINIHRASISGSSVVGKYSAGCTVINDPDSFDELIYLCKQQVRHNNWSRFTYTLMFGLDHGTNSN